MKSVINVLVYRINMVRDRLWGWLRRDVADGEVLPKYLIPIMLFLYPSRIGYWIGYRVYRPDTDVYNIHGLKISGVMIMHFAHCGNRWFRITKSENGCITIETKHEETSEGTP